MLCLNNLGDYFPFDWLVKRFQTENIVDILNGYSRNYLFHTLLFLQMSKNSLQTLYVYLANSYLKCHETKIEIKSSLHELLG